MAHEQDGNNFAASIEVNEEVKGHILFAFTAEGMKVDGEGLNEAYIGSALLSLCEKLVTEAKVEQGQLITAINDYLTHSLGEVATEPAEEAEAEATE